MSPNGWSERVEGILLRNGLPVLGRLGQIIDTPKGRLMYFGNHKRAFIKGWLNKITFNRPVFNPDGSLTVDGENYRKDVEESPLKLHKPTGEPEKVQVIFWKQKRPEFKSTIQAMKYFRKDTGLVGNEIFDMRLTNGVSCVDKDGAWLHWNTTAYLAKQVPIHDVKNLMILMAYVNEKDLQLRGIAILALDRSLAAYPNGLSADAVTDVESKRHVQLVERFAQKIAERARGR